MLVDNSLCIGCKACTMACPYEARYFLERLQSYFPGEATPYERSRPTLEHQQGTVEKCTFCVHRLDAGLQPACVDTCPTKARHFGDLEDPESEVSLLSRDPRAVQPSPDWGTDPSVYYLLPYIRQ